jgi:hypothetical protein
MASLYERYWQILECLERRSQFQDFGRPYDAAPIPRLNSELTIVVELPDTAPSIG